MDRIEIIKALKVLKNMCECSIDCCMCPCVLPRLSEKGKPIFCCGLTDIAPSFWKIKEDGPLLEDI